VIDKKNIEAIFPLTPMQQALLAHSLLAGEQDDSVLQVRCTLTGQLDTSALEAAWKLVGARHQALRTSVHWQKTAQPLQVVHKEAAFEIIHSDARDLADAGAADWQSRILQNDRAEGLDLTHAPVTRLTCVRLTDDRSFLLWTCHHLLLDGWSASLILRELFSLYSCYVTGGDAKLPRAGSFRNHVNWLKQQDLAAAEIFWREELKDVKKPTPLPFESNGSGDSFEKVEATIDPALVMALEARARSLRITPNTLLMTAWASTLAASAGVPEVVFGTTVSGRSGVDPTVQATAGLFMNIVPVKFSAPASSEPVDDWLKRFQAAQIEAQRFDYVSLADVQKWSTIPGRQRLFDSLFVFENFPFDATFGADQRALQVSDFEGDFTSNYPLTCVVKPGDPWAVELLYDSQKLSPQRMQQWLQEFLQVLQKLCSETSISEWWQCEGSSSELEMLPAERKQPGPKVDSPRSHLEFMVSTLFQDLLGGDPIGIHDNFFDLGGTSLLAIRLFTDLQKKTGIGLPLATLFEAPNVAAIAEKLAQNNWKPQWSSLVPIRPDGDLTPLYFVHGAGANVLEFRHLIRHLNPDRPAFGIQSVALDGVTPPHTKFEDMAAHYISEIREHQPEGPYALAGLCLGGIVAYEMARQLNEAGQDVAVLALFDASTPHAFRALPRRDRLRYSMISYGQRLRYNAGKFMLGPGRRQHFRDKVRALSKRLHSRRWQRQHSKQSPEPTAPPAASLENSIVETIRVAREASILALERYEPGRYAGDMTLFRPEHLSIGTIPEPTLGWRYLVDGNVEVIESPGDHVTIIREPFVGVLAKRLDELLERADDARTTG
jgi:thioesterase domain-containing protein/acyl carrier protein